MAGVLSQVWRHQQLYPILPDQLIVGDVPPSANVGIDRYLSSGTGSRGEANQLHGGPPAFLLDMLHGFIADSYLHCTNLSKLLAFFTA